MYQWLKDLFPLNRSITGEGNRLTIKYFKKINPELKNIKFKSFFAAPLDPEEPPMDQKKVIEIKNIEIGTNDSANPNEIELNLSLEK